MAHHAKYTDAHGNPFGVANHDTEADLLRRRQVEAANQHNAKPFPASWALSEDTPEKRRAEAAHSQQIVADLNRAQGKES